MINQFYRVELNDKNKAEFYIVKKNELNPKMNILELGVCIFNDKDLQLDGLLDVNAIDSLMQYLSECKEYIVEYNENSKIIVEP